jgi:hypothetical protein
MASVLSKLNRRVPWARRMVWSLKYRFNRSVRPYNGIWDKVQDYLAGLDKCTPPVNAEGPKLLVYASAIGARFWIDYLLPLSVLLAARGAKVEFVWSDTPTDSPGGYLRDFLEWSSTFSYPTRENWKALRLDNLAVADPMPGEVPAWLHALARLDTCQLVRKETLDDKDDKDRTTLAYRLEVNTQAWKRFHTLLAQGHYDRVLLVNGELFENAVLLKACKEFGVPCVTTEIAERDDTLHFAIDKAVWDLDIDHLWKADAPHQVTAERLDRIARLRRVRSAPQLGSGQVMRFQNADVAEAANIRKALNLDASQKLAVVCTNVVWDSAVLGKGRTHATMREWLIDTIRWFAGRTGWQVVIRTHPHEDLWGSNEPVGKFIRQAYPELPGNVRLILPSDPINTYSLLPLANLGMVFSTTVGLEMAMEGLTVVTAGKVHYAGRGFTVDANSREEYYEELERLTAREVTTRDPRVAELAMCYFDIYMNQIFRPMPWRWTHLDEDLRRFPISHLASSRCEVEYARVYDYVLGLRAEPQ